MISLFVSSIQKELVQVRLTVLEWIASDSFLCKLFIWFLFDKLPTLDIRAEPIF